MRALSVRRRMIRRRNIRRSFPAGSGCETLSSTPFSRRSKESKARLRHFLDAHSSRKSVFVLDDGDTMFPYSADCVCRYGHRGITGTATREASGQARWFERLLGELNIELWIGDATEIARKRGRKQKTDRQDAQHIPALATERRLSTDLGAELGESRSAADAVAPAPHGAGAHAHHEPAASGSHERRRTLQEKSVAGEGTRATGVV